MCGVCLPLALLSIVARSVTVAVLLFCVKMWVDTSASRAAGESGADSFWIMLLAILALFDFLFCSVGGCLLALSCWRLSSRLHENMLRSVLLCPVSFFEATPRGRVLNRFSADLDLVDCQLYMTVKEVVQTLTVVVARLAVVGTLAPAACFLGLLATAVYITAVVAAVRTSNVLRSLENASMSQVLQHAAETRDTMSSVRCYGAVSLVCRRFYRLIDEAMRYCWAMVACVRFTRVTGGLAGLSAVFATVVALLLSSSPQSVSGEGRVLSTAISILTTLSAVNAALFFAFISTVAFERAVEYTRLQPEDALNPKAGKFARVLRETGSQEVWPSEGCIAFEEFTASYKPGVLPPVLKSVSLVKKPREKVGVVGRTGAGKSSLILALLRVLVPSAGHIVIDGINISSVPRRTLRSAVTVIPKEPYMMKGTLRDNLDATQSHSDSQVWEALKSAHLDDFVSKHPSGLLMEIDDGAENLSAGQRQLVCLARALLRRPRVLLLDEATSRMDGDTDRIVQRTLRQCFAQCTVITVAHRLRTVMHCDRIMVMSDGSVAEFGSVEQLAAKEDSVFWTTAWAAGIDLSSL